MRQMQQTILAQSVSAKALRVVVSLPGCRRDVGIDADAAVAVVVVDVSVVNATVLSSASKLGG